MMIVSFSAVSASTWLLILAGSMLQANDSPKSDPAAKSVQIYVTPYYNSDGPEIQVGKDSQRIKDADTKTILELATELKKKQDSLRAEEMYVIAIRLYDLGHKDESVFWFYTAQYRARLFAGLLNNQKVGGLGSEAFELKQAYGAFNELAGIYINGYAFGDLVKLEQTLTLVAQEGKTLPKFEELYPNVAFIDKAGWETANDKVSTGLAGLVDYIKINRDAIKEQRKQSGIEGKY